jgi:acyl-CoA hydrolase
MSRVYILGAGCSYHEQYGYPLAKQFIAELNSYAGKIEGIAECQRIKKATEDTVKLFTQGQSGSSHASTIDPTDCNYLVECIRQAKKCERIVIQNLPAECDRIESLLKIDYKIQILIEKCQTPF